MAEANGSTLPPLRIVVGSDNAGHTLKSTIKKDFESHPLVSKVLDVGVLNADDGTAYPHVAVDASTKITAGEVSSLTSQTSLWRPPFKANLYRHRLTERFSSVVRDWVLPFPRTKSRAFER